MFKKILLTFLQGSIIGAIVGILMFVFDQYCWPYIQQVIYQITIDRTFLNYLLWIGAVSLFLFSAFYIVKTLREHAPFWQRTLIYFLVLSFLSGATTSSVTITILKSW